MDPDSKSNAAIRSGPLLLAALIVLCAAILVAMNRLDGKDLIALVGSAISVAGVARMMTFPAATTTTKDTDPSGATRETKTTAPLGIPPVTPPAPVSPSPTGGPTP
jgi:hypothetical protein